MRELADFLKVDGKTTNNVSVATVDRELEEILESFELPKTVKLNTLRQQIKRLSLIYGDNKYNDLISKLIIHEDMLNLVYYKGASNLNRVKIELTGGEPSVDLTGLQGLVSTETYVRLYNLHYSGNSVQEVETSLYILFDNLKYYNVPLCITFNHTPSHEELFKWLQEPPNVKEVYGEERRERLSTIVDALSEAVVKAEYAETFVNSKMLTGEGILTINTLSDILFTFDHNKEINGVLSYVNTGIANLQVNELTSTNFVINGAVVEFKSDGDTELHNLFRVNGLDFDSETTVVKLLVAIRYANSYTIMK